jgi:LPXTG-motif cell wall-anchored protein
MTKTKVLVGVGIVAVAGAIGYILYKKKKESSINAPSQASTSAVEEKPDRTVVLPTLTSPKGSTKIDLSSTALGRQFKSLFPNAV